MSRRVKGSLELLDYYKQGEILGLIPSTTEQENQKPELMRQQDFAYMLLFYFIILFLPPQARHLDLYLNAIPVDTEHRTGPIKRELLTRKSESVTQHSKLKPTRVDCPQLCRVCAHTNKANSSNAEKKNHA